MQTLCQNLRYAARSFAEPHCAVCYGNRDAYPRHGINPSQGITQSNMSVPDFVDWQNQNQVVEQPAGFVAGRPILTSGDETERVRGTSVTADFFRLFRTNAQDRQRK